MEWASTRVGTCLLSRSDRSCCLCCIWVLRQNTCGVQAGMLSIPPQDAFNQVRRTSELLGSPYLLVVRAVCMVSQVAHCQHVC
jgi:hypothetical protein